MAPNSSWDTLQVVMMHGCACQSISEIRVPLGHCLTRARLRHLRESEWVIVSANSLPMGLAAYKAADSDVRVVHELLVDRTLTDRDAARVTDALLAALEVLAYDEGVSCLMFLINGAVALRPFQEHGYSPIVVDQCGAWVQKKLNSLGWVSAHSLWPS